jgi:hypothetical protein
MAISVIPAPAPSTEATKVDDVDPYQNEKLEKQLKEINFHLASITDLEINNLTK